MLSTHTSKLNSTLGTFRNMCPERVNFWSVEIQTQSCWVRSANVESVLQSDVADVANTRLHVALWLCTACNKTADTVCWYFIPFAVPLF